MGLDQLRFKFFREWGHSYARPVVAIEFSEISGQGDYLGLLLVEIALGHKRLRLGINYGRKPKMPSRLYTYDAVTDEDAADNTWQAPQVGDLVECIDHEETCQLSEGRLYRIIGEVWKPHHSQHRRLRVMRRYVTVQLGQHSFDYEDTRFKTVAVKDNR